MRGLIARLFGRAAPTMSEANARDIPAIAAVHAASFQRGWGEDEFRRLLLERNVVCHRSQIGRTLVGFILSRLVAGEAEILSVAVEAGLARARIVPSAARLASAPAGRIGHPHGVSRGG